jgi:hypothetical protein
VADSTWFSVNILIKLEVFVWLFCLLDCPAPIIDRSTYWKLKAAEISLLSRLLEVQVLDIFNFKLVGSYLTIIWCVLTVGIYWLWILVIHSQVHYQKIEYAFANVYSFKICLAHHEWIHTQVCIHKYTTKKGNAQKSCIVSIYLALTCNPQPN